MKMIQEGDFLHFFNIKFAVSKNVRIFAVQYRGIEQSVARRAHNPKVVRFESHSRYYRGKSSRFSSFFISLRREYGARESGENPELCPQR